MFSLCSPRSLWLRLQYGQFRYLRQHAGELSSLEQFTSASAAACQAVLAGADGLRSSPGRFHGQEITVPARGDKPEHPIFVFRNLDEDHPAARARQEIHFINLAE